MKIYNSLNRNIELLKSELNYDETIIFREIMNSSSIKLKFCIVYAREMVKMDAISQYVIEPLLDEDLKNVGESSTIAEEIMASVILSAGCKIVEDIDLMVESVLRGEVLLLIEGENRALVIPTKGWEHRSIGEPTTEKSVRGPKEAFTENIEVNLSQIRKRLPTNELILQFKVLGFETKTKICICYLKNKASGEIVDELNRRLDKIKMDSVLDIKYIEEMITDTTFSPFKTIGSTERPDVLVGKLIEGKIGILCDGTPFALTLPFLFIEYFHTGEDYYSNFIYASIARILRISGFYLTISIPALYLAAITYHQEMIETNLLISIISAREGVPFPSALEMIIFLFIFEAIIEASARLPVAIGQTIGIVGALVIGQAAVEARLISAPMIILIAFTGITTFLITELRQASILVRIGFIICVSLMGLYGFIFGWVGLLFYLCSLRSFGVNYMEYSLPLNWKDLLDTLVSAPWPVKKKRNK